MLTVPIRPAAALGLFLVAAGASALARPVRCQVEGVSMAPGLMPGDIVVTGVFPALSRMRGPGRFDRWLLTPPVGGTAIKRVVGLPGETVSIVGGDLTVDGRMIVSPPRILAETASPVPAGAAPSAAAACRRTVAADVVLDDAAFAPHERRLLLPVRDVGLAATVLVRGRRDGPPRIRARVGDFVVVWRPPSAGSFAVVAGRLDGHLVAACWEISSRDSTQRDRRGCLPPGVPAAWQVARPWPTARATAHDDTVAPEIGLCIGNATGDECCGDGDPVAGEIVTFGLWRDLLHRPAADGRDAWRLGPDEFLLFGDFPSGSHDSRHWGPLPRGALRAAVTGPR